MVLSGRRGVQVKGSGMGRVAWERAIVASLMVSKRSGRYSFATSWQIAVRENPPRSQLERDIMPAVRGFCEDAWLGRRPALRHFSLDMLRDDDGARAALSAGIAAVTAEARVAA